MKHPFWDRILMLICVLLALCGAAGLVLLLLGKVSLSDAASWVGSIDLSKNVVKVIVGACAVVLALFALLLISAMLPSAKKRSSNFAIQRNENGMVRISLKALETLVSKCLNQHAELKVVTSSLYSDEESIRVDVHIALQSDISMPLAISALQKQIKRYIEACSGVQVQEVRVFVDSTIPATEETVKSPYAIPESLLIDSAGVPGENCLQANENTPAAQEGTSVQPEEAPADEAAAQDTAAAQAVESAAASAEPAQAEATEREAEAATAPTTGEASVDDTKEVDSL